MKSGPPPARNPALAEKDGPEASNDPLASQTWRTDLLGSAGGRVLAVIGKTLQWKLCALEDDGVGWAQGEPTIMSFWHGHHLLMPYAYHKGIAKDSDVPAAPLTALISEHGDGRIVAKAMEYHGVGSVPGSSSRGGTRALLALISLIRRGHHIAMAIDGPKGPIYRVKPGIIKVAQVTGAPIYPFAAAADRRWTFKSWDRMFLPKPFARVVLRRGPPLYVPGKLSAEGIEEYRVKFEEMMAIETQKAEEDPFLRGED